MRELLAWLAGWQNWIFLVPLGMAMVMVGFDAATGGLVDLDVDVDADADADVEGDVSTGLFAWFGVGKIPLTLLLEIFAMSFGATGILVNAVTTDVFGDTHVLAFPFALGLATLVATLSTKTLGGVLANLMPSNASTASHPDAFIGQLGVATSPVDHRIGQIRLPGTADIPSTVLSARLERDIATSIPRGMEVLIVRYDTNSRVYTVIPNPMEV